MMNNPKLHIFDLDGCIVDDEWRLPLCDWKNREFKNYHDHIEGDKSTLVIGKRLLEMAVEGVVKNGDALVFITARPVTHATQTHRQIRSLLGLGNYMPYRLFMREEHEEGLPSAELKKRRTLEVVSLHPEIKLKDIWAYDDHPDVVKMYADLGINSFLVNRRFCVDGGYNAALISIRRGDAGALYNVWHSKHDPLANIGFVMRDGVTIPRHITKLSEELIGGIDDQTCREMPLVNPKIEGRVFMGYDPSKYNSDVTGIAEIKINDGNVTLSADKIKIIASGAQLFTPAEPKPRKTAADILAEASETFRERNAAYKDNAVVVADVMNVLFPNGVKLDSPEDYHMWHLFELIIVKLTRFTNSDLRHTDSIHDLMVYAAMIEPLTESHNIEFGEVK